MFSLGRADVFAPGDLALQEAARLIFDLPARPKEKELRAMAQAWSPWRSVAARIMWAYYKEHKQQGRHQMTRALEAQRREPVSGETRSCVVFLHGYGANAADLMGLADPFGRTYAGHAVHRPDAPEACAGSPDGLAVVPDPLDRRIKRGRKPRGYGQRGRRSGCFP